MEENKTEEKKVTVAQYPQKMPDLSRNEKLAGMVVYSRGFNVFYDDEGYAVKAIKADFVNDDGVKPAGEKARPIEEVLAEIEEKEKNEKNEEA